MFGGQAQPAQLAPPGPQTGGPLVSYETWLAALASSACIGFTSLVPWLFNMTFFEQAPASRQAGTQQHATQANPDYRMKFLLSFAVGAILGDIFFHLIPESFQSHITELGDLPEAAHRKVGVSIIAGIFMFIIVEMLLEKWSNSMTSNDKVDNSTHTNKSSAIGESEFIIRAKPAADKDLKRTIGALINYFEDNNKLENNNNNSNLIKNLNFHLNNNHHHHQQQKGDVLDRRRPPIESETESNNNLVCDNLTTIKLTNSQQLRCRQAQLATTISNRHNGATFADKQDTKQMLCPEDEEKNEDDCFAKSLEPSGTSRKKDERSAEVAGYLSLIANGFDNFTHGLAIGASFLVGPKVGLLTTFVIFIHEIPHEICDYAILVNSGFSRWDAAKAQSSVSLFGILGTATALYVKSIETLTAKTCWILPFSAGGFLYIALVNLLPEILDHGTSFRNSTGQIACVTLGIAFMALVGVI